MPAVRQDETPPDGSRLAVVDRANPKPRDSKARDLRQNGSVAGIARSLMLAWGSRSRYPAWKGLLRWRWVVAKSFGGTCRSCGGPLTANAVFCPECGAAVPKFVWHVRRSADVAGSFCPGCGFGFGFGDGSSAALTAPPAAPVSRRQALRLFCDSGTRQIRRRRARRRRTQPSPAYPPVALALAVVVVPGCGRPRHRDRQLGGAATTAGTSAAPSGPVQSPAADRQPWRPRRRER